MKKRKSVKDKKFIDELKNKYAKIPMWTDEIVCKGLKEMSNDIWTKEQKAYLDQRFDKLEKSIDQRFEVVDQRFDKLEKSIDKRFEAVDQRFDKLEKSIDKRFGAVDQRFEAIDQRFDEQNKKFDQIIQILARNGMK